MLSTFDPNVQVLEMPYTFRNTEIAREVLNGPFGHKLSDQLAKSSNIRILSYLPSAFRSFINSKHEIHSPADMKGMKIRTMEIPIHMEMVRALGATATPISWSELYSALQTGVVDGAESAPYVILLGKLQEVQKYYTLDRHTLNLALIIINDKFFKSLPPEDQRIFSYAARQAQLAMLGVVAAKETQDFKTIREAGMKIYKPKPEEFNQFKDLTREPVLKIMRKKVEEKWIADLNQAIDVAEKKMANK